MRNRLSKIIDSKKLEYQKVEEDYKNNETKIDTLDQHSSSIENSIRDIIDY